MVPPIEPTTAIGKNVSDCQTRSSTRRNLCLSAADGGCFGGMVACGETYLPAFALAVGLSEMAAALTASVPVLVGGIVQLISPWGLRKVGSPQRWIVVSATIQAFSFLPLVFAAVSGSLALTPLLLIASVYWGAGMATGPAWNTWMEEIVPSRIRTIYFPRRTGIQLIATFVMLLASGFILQVADSDGQAMLAFAALFATAMGLRLVSVVLLASHRQPPSNTRRVLSKNNNASNGNGSPIRLIAFLVMVQAAVQLSGPFFAPYMLEQLRFSYGQYMFLISIAFLAKVIALRYLGLLARKIGSQRLLVFGSIGLVPISAFWIVSSNIYWLLVIQVISGFVWAAYELGFFLLFFEAIPVDRRTRLLSLYNFANALALVVGAGVGSLVLQVYGCTPEAYYWLFGLSSVGRLACLPILPYSSARGPGSLVSVTLRALSLRPSGGSLDVPILPSIKRK